MPRRTKRVCAYSGFAGAGKQLLRFRAWGLGFRAYEFLAFLVLGTADLFVDFVLFFLGALRGGLKSSLMMFKRVTDWWLAWVLSARLPLQEEDAGGSKYLVIMYPPK